MFLSLNMMYGPINKIGEIPLAAVIMGAFILVVVGIFSLLAVRDFLQLIIREQKIGVEWYPIVISVYFMIILTQNLIVQYDLSFISSTISIIYAAMALGCIIFGFIKRYSLIRKYGLGLAILSVIKLILIDFANLTRGYRVVSYFILGIILVAISFIYQYFSKRLELKKGGLSNENTHS